MDGCAERHTSFQWTEERAAAIAGHGLPAKGVRDFSLTELSLALPRPPWHTRRDVEIVRRVPPPAPGPPGPAADADAARRAVDDLRDHLRRLRALPAHGNRRLHLDHLVVGLLLSFYDPVIRSLRLVEARGDFGGRIDLDRMARSTTADALAASDPRLLKPLVEDLVRRAGELRRPRHADDPLRGIAWRVVAGDGTYLTTLANVAWALRHTQRGGRAQGQVRLNVQLETAAWTPLVLTVSGDDGCSEPAAFGKDLLAGVLYVFDRNFLDFAFLGLVLARDSHFVLRVRGNAPAARVLRTLALTPDDAAAGVASDQVVELTGRGAPAGEFRLVVVRTTNRKGQAEELRLLTDLADRELVPARLVGAVYRERWQVELFFKWLKAWAGLDHLFSTSRNGVTSQFYVAVVAVLLMYVRLGRRVSRHALACPHLLLHGRITAAQMFRTPEKLEREKERARERAAARRAREKLP
jgi:hypothetical protein